MKLCAKSGAVKIFTFVEMLVLFSATLAPLAQAADYNWRSESGSGHWDYAGGADSDKHWWDGASSVNTPGSGGCNNIIVDNNTFPAWDQNISGYSCSKLLFNAGASSIRTLTGFGITFYDCGGVSPAIINSSAVTHVIGALTGGLVGSWNYPLVVQTTTGSVGGLTIESDMDNRGPYLQVSNSNLATIAMSGSISGTGGVRKVGLGSLTLSGNNTFSGGLIHYTGGGRLDLAHANALGSGTYTVSGNIGFDNTSGGSLTISNAVSLSGGSPYFVGSNPLTMAGPVTVASANRTLTVSNSTVTIAGVIDGTVGFGKAGTGALVLTGSNTFAGGFTLGTGLLNIGHPNALGTNTFTANGGTFDNQTGGDLVLPNPFTIGSGNSTYAGTNYAMTITNTILINASRAVAVTSNKLTLASGISESGVGGYVLSKNGNGIMVLNASNDIRGGITVGTGGGLYIGHPNALGTGTFTCAQSTIENTSGGPLTLTNDFKFNGNPAYGGEFHPLTFAGPVTLNGGNRNIYVSNNVFTFSGVVTGNNSLAKYSAGTLVLSGNNSFTGGLLMSAGTIGIGHSNALGTGPLTLGTVGMDNVNTGTVTVANRVVWNGSAAYVGSAGDLELSGPIVMNLGRTMTVSNRTLTFSGTVSSNVILTKAGAGTLTLSGNNTNLGGVAVSAGTLNIGHQNSLGVTGAFSAGTASFDNTSGGALVLSNAFTFAGNPTFLGTQPLTFTGAVSLVSSRILTVAGGTLTLAGHIVNANLSLTKDGPGTLVLSGTNSHQSGTILSNGTLCINSPTAIGSGRFGLIGVSTLDNTSGGAISLANNNLQDWSADFTFTGGNALDMGTGTVYLNGNRSITVLASTLTVGGTITVTNGLASGLTKNGGGKLVIGKAVVYTGDTTVNDGTLELNGAGALSTSSNITVASGATLDVSLRTNGLLALTSVQTLKGGGTVVGTVTNAGTVAPGASPGTLSVAGDYAQSGTLAIELSGTTPGSGHDVMAVSGNASLGGTLTVTTPSFTPAGGNSFTILTATAVAGTFATTNLPAGDWTVDYQADKVVLTLAGSSGPTVGPVTLTRDYGQPLHVLESALMTNSVNAGGGALTCIWVSATSSNSQPVSLSGGWVLYNASNTYNGIDQFNFRLANTNGDWAESTATVLVSSPATNTTAIATTAITNGGLQFVWAGIPGRTNRVDGATELAPGNWSNIGVRVIDALGKATFFETNPPSPRYYRVTE